MTYLKVKKKFKLSGKLHKKIIKILKNKHDSVNQIKDYSQEADSLECEKVLTVNMDIN